MECETLDNPSTRILSCLYHAYTYGSKKDKRDQHTNGEVASTARRTFLEMRRYASQLGLHVFVRHSDTTINKVANL